MKVRLTFGCALFFLCVARGGTIYSTFGPGGTFNPGLGLGAVGPFQMAFPFTVPAGSNYLFQSASLALGEGVGSNNSVTISLAANAAGVPGSILETFGATVQPFPNDTVPVTVTSVLDPLLTANSVYWLIVYAAAGNGVNWTTANILTNPDLLATRPSSVASWTANPLLSGSNNPGAFSVDGNAASAVPEGTTWSLCFVGLAFLALKAAIARKDSLPV
jgi:hypothetical protein